MRFGERLRVAIAVSDDADACLVPPLLLQPLVENAVTHGVAHVLDGGTVHGHGDARRQPAARSTVENPCDPDRPRRAGTGLGLPTCARGCAALYGDDARFAAARERRHVAGRAGAAGGSRDDRS